MNIWLNIINNKLKVENLNFDSNETSVTDHI